MGFMYTVYAYLLCSMLKEVALLEIFFKEPWQAVLLKFVVILHNFLFFFITVASKWTLQQLCYFS